MNEFNSKVNEEIAKALSSYPTKYIMGGDPKMFSTAPSKFASMFDESTLTGEKHPLKYFTHVTGVKASKPSTKNIMGEDVTVKIENTETTLHTTDENITLQMLKEFAQDCYIWTSIPDYVKAHNGTITVRMSDDFFDHEYEAFNEVKGVVHGDDEEEFFYCEDPQSEEWAYDSIDGIHGQIEHEVKKAQWASGYQHVVSANLILEPFFDGEDMVGLLEKTRRKVEEALALELITEEQVHDFTTIASGAGVKWAYHGTNIEEVIANSPGLQDILKDEWK